MRPTCTFLLLCLTAFVSAQKTAAPKISADPLTADQIAVYQAFLADYNSGSKAALNVANITSPFAPDSDPILSSGGRHRDSCLDPFPPKISATEVHKLPDSLAGSKVRLVDPIAHRIVDPGDAIRGGQDVKSAVDAGFAAALMTVSEVVFDTQHHLAAFSYSFHCGSLCGNGGIVIYELKDGHWVRAVASRCSSWIS